MTDLHKLVGVLTEHLGVLFDLLLVAALGRLDEHQQGHVGLQEGVGDVVHHRLPQLQDDKTNSGVRLLSRVGRRSSYRPPSEEQHVGSAKVL